MGYIHVKEIEIPLYRGTLVIIISNDNNEVKKHLPSFEDNQIYAHSIYTNWNNSQGFVVLLNFASNYMKMTNGAIAYEAMHTANFIADFRGIESSFTNDEPIAYLVEFITDQIYSMMKEHRFKATCM